MAIRIDVDTLSGILAAQKRLQKLLPVDNGPGVVGMTTFDDMLKRVRKLDIDEARELTLVLVALKSHCRTLGLSQIDVEGDLR